MNRCALFFVSILSLVSSVQAVPLFDTDLPTKEKKIADANVEGGQQQQRTLIEIKRSLMEWQNKRYIAEKQHSDYQKALKELEHARSQLVLQLVALKDNPLPLQPLLEQQQLNQPIVFSLKKMFRQTQKIEQCYERKRCIEDELNEFPTKFAELTKKLADAKERQKRRSYQFSSKKLQGAELQAEIAAYKAQLEALQSEQCAKQKELEYVQLEIDVLCASYRALYQQQVHYKRLLADATAAETLQYVLDLSLAQFQQVEKIEEMKSAQQEIIEKSNQVYGLIDDMRRQAQRRPLSQLLRARATSLAKVPKATSLNRVMDKLIVQKLNYSKALEALSKTQRAQNDAYQAAIEEILLNVLKALVDASEQAIEVLEQLDQAHAKFEQDRRALQTAVNRHLFWSPDSSSIDFNFPVKIIKGINTLLSVDRGSLSQIMTTLSSSSNIALITIALMLVALGLSLGRRYQHFLKYAAVRIGKVHQDTFDLTFSTFLWSLWASLPLPVLVAAIGYSFKAVNEAIGEGVMATVPVFWALKVGAHFAKPQGLFIKHFSWDADKVAHAIRYYALAVWLAVPLIMMTITFNNLDGGKFADTLGRLSFMLFCVVLIVLTLGLRRAGVPLYLDRQGSDRNICNYILWSCLISALPLAIFFSALGYLIASQQLLLRLEMSVAIWFSFLMIYHVIRRWILIQRRRIAFERAKQRRADQLAQRARFDEELSSAEGALLDAEEFVVDLDIISVRSLQLLRSIIAMATLVSLIWLWSEIHPAFVFLESVHLWSVQTVIQGVPTVQTITLGTGLIAMLVLVVTTQLVRNLPALLELSLLQHIDLSPGTGYAITTLTKHLLTLFGVLIFFSLLGIDWPRIQWVATGLGVGLGFGLKDIFANFISGLFILFEKPIRIGDTVTVRGDLTGTVTKINSRATVITDWDRKEIIMPNHALLTEQFVNWTLTDSITRIVLQIPAPADADSTAVAKLLEKALKRCTLVLQAPPPEVYLNEVHQGVQCFEVRVYANEMGHRMPLRNEVHQQIMACYHEAQMPLPYPPVQVRVETISHRKLPLQSAL